MAGTVALQWKLIYVFATEHFYSIRIDIIYSPHQTTHLQWFLAPVGPRDRSISPMKSSKRQKQLVYILSTSIDLKVRILESVWIGMLQIYCYKFFFIKHFDRSVKPTICHLLQAFKSRTRAPNRPYHRSWASCSSRRLWTPRTRLHSPPTPTPFRRRFRAFKTHRQRRFRRSPHLQRSLNP